MRFFRFIRIVFVFVGFLFITLLSSGTCFGSSQVPVSPNKEDKCIVCKYIGNFVLSTLVWKINVPITWTNYYDNSEGFRGAIFGKGWYPKALSFKNGNFKIGFFLFEFRPVELVFVWFFILRNWKSYRINDKESTLPLIPIHLHFFHIKWRCVRMLWFSIINIIMFVVSIKSICRKVKCCDDHVYFFVTEEFHKKTFNGYIYLLTLLIPSISIDMSWFNKNNKKEKVSWED